MESRLWYTNHTLTLAPVPALATANAEIWSTLDLHILPHFFDVVAKIYEIHRIHEPSRDMVGKRVTTFAKRGDRTIRNPFTNRRVDPHGKSARPLIELARNGNRFRSVLKEAGVPKPDRQSIVGQWKYIAGLSDVPPKDLPYASPIQVKNISASGYGGGSTRKDADLHRCRRTGLKYKRDAERMRTRLRRVAQTAKYDADDGSSMPTARDEEPEEYDDAEDDYDDYDDTYPNIQSPKRATPRERNGSTFISASSVSDAEVPEPFVFLIGPGAFAKPSKDTVRKIGPMLREAWEGCPRYSESQRTHNLPRGWNGTDEDYFLTGTTAERLSHCMSRTAMEHYVPMLLAAWEYMYEDARRRRPSTIHSILKTLDGIADGAGNPVLVRAISANVDGLEYAAGLEPGAVMPGYGSVLLRQPIDTAICKARPNIVRSVAEIRSGRYRPAMVLEDEYTAIVPSESDLDGVIEDTRNGGTLVLYNMSDAPAISAFLENCRFDTTIVVNSNAIAAERTQAMLDSSSDITAGGVRVPECESNNEDPGVVCGFHANVIIGLRGADELLRLFKRLYTDFRVAGNRPRDPDMLENMLQNQAAYTK